MQENDKETESEKTKDDRWHAGKIKNGDANEANELGVLAVLTQIDGAADSDSERKNH